MRILLTGATGFLGGHLLPRLVGRYGALSVVALASRPVEGVRTVPWGPGRTVPPDLFASAGCADTDVLVHLGAFTPKSGAEADDAVRSEENVRVLSELLAADLPSLRRVLCVSTLDVYAPTDGVISETSPVGPVSRYGESKLRCEELVRRFGVARGIDVGILRIGHVYGPGEGAYRKLIPATIANVLDGREVPVYGDGSDVRTFIYAGDVAEAIVRAVETPFSGEVVNLVGARPVTVLELVRTVFRLCEREERIAFRPRAGAVRNLRFDNAKMRRMLGGETVGLEEGLRREIEEACR